MEANGKLMQLLKDTFTEPEIFNIAVYIISSIAVGEAAHTGIMKGGKTVEGLPAQAVETVYLYDSGLVKNDFFLKHFPVIKSAIVADRIKLASTTELARVAEETGDPKIWEAVRDQITSKMDSLSLLAFLWKDYEFAIDFTCKLKLVYKIPDELRQFLNIKIDN